MQTLRLASITLILAAACTGPATPGDDDTDQTLAADAGDASTDDSGAVTAEAKAPNLSVFFSVPLANGHTDPALQNKIVEMIGMAKPHSELHMSIYQFSSKTVADAFIEAARRKVHVHLIVDEEANETGGKLTAALVSLRAYAAQSAYMTLTFCTRGSGSCQGTGIDHNKFYLFSALSDGSTNVVVQSSANLTGFHLHNNMVIDRNDKSLYDGYLDYWNDLHARHEDLGYYRAHDGNHTIAYFFPRESGDTIPTILSHVKCTSSSKIRVTMAFWDDGRTDIADELVHLKSKGCDVQINMRKPGTNVSANIINKLKHGHISVAEYPSEHGNNIHSKYLLIDAEYAADGKHFTKRKLLWTGSHNYTTGALRHNDETLLRVDNASVFDAFWNNWNTIRHQITAAHTAVAADAAEEAPEAFDGDDAD